RIDPTAKKRSDWYIGDQVRRNCLAQKPVKLVTQECNIALVVGASDRHIPVLTLLYTTALCQEIMTRQQLLNTLKNRLWIGNTHQVQEITQCGIVYSGWYRTVGQQGFEL